MDWCDFAYSQRIDPTFRGSKVFNRRANTILGGREHCVEIFLVAHRYDYFRVHGPRPALESRQCALGY